MWPNVIPRPICLVLLAALFLLASSVPAYADAIDDCDSCCQNNCTSGCKHGETNCVEKTSGRCTLHAEIICGSGDPGIYLDDNADLDMLGQDITCSGTCNYPAVTAPAGETNRVYNSSGNFESSISGAFDTGVLCDRDKPDQVDGITIGIEDGNINAVTGYGTRECRKVLNNIIVGDGSANSVGVYLFTTANSDKVNENFIKGFETGIDIDYTVTINALRNVLDTDSMAIAIKLISNSSTDMDNNFFMGTGADANALLISGGPTHTGNIADPDHPDYDDCVNDDKCVGLGAPYPGSQ